MKTNERIYVKSYDCQSIEDDFENGESLTPDSSWTSKDTRFENAPDGYASVEDALKDVCKHEFFDFNKKNWISFGKDYGDEYGRFEGSIMVDVDNNQASKSAIKAWKDGKLRLLNCHIHVYLEIRLIREFTEEDALSF